MRVMSTKACIHVCAHRHTNNVATDVCVIVSIFVIQRLKIENSNHKTENAAFWQL